MAIQAGYWVDLTGVKFDEESTSTWIQAMPLGEYEHPVHGKIKIDPQRVQHFADNVNNKVRGQDLDIDYDHKAQNGEAAGWVRQAQARADGLWLLVEWTKQAASKIKDKAYRYFSPEFVDEWTHPKEGVKYSDVLFGGGITNRPFLKDILPINMSELVEAARREESPQKLEEGRNMDTKALSKLLGLPEDSTEEALTAKIGELQAAPKAPEPEKLAEPNDELKKLAESHPAVKKLSEMLETQQRLLDEQSAKLSETTKSLREAEIGNQVTKLSEAAAAKKLAFPPAVLEEVTKALSETDPSKVQSLTLSAFEALAKTGMVELGERSKLTPGSHEETDAVKRFSDAVVQVQKDNQGMGYADAVSRVTASDPQLWEDYRQASFAGRE